MSTLQAVHLVGHTVDRELFDEDGADPPRPPGVVEPREDGLGLLGDVALPHDDVAGAAGGRVHRLHPLRGVGGTLEHRLELGAVGVLHHAVLPELEVLGVDDEERDVAGHGRLLLLRRKGRG